MKNKEYSIVAISLDRVIPFDTMMERFNTRLNRLRSEGWYQFGEPSLSIDHTYMTLIMWREIPNANGPYR